MSIEIRMGNKDDAALIADMSRQTFYETFAPDNKVEDMEKFLAEQFTREALIAEVDTPEHTFLLAYADGEPAGYACLREWKTDQNGIELARLYAASYYIGKGIGKALMQACIELAQQQGKKIISLGVWEKNERAIRFYKAWGFEKVGQHPFRLGNDMQVDWIMQKEIG